MRTAALSRCVMLHTILHGAPTDRIPLLIVHGLYGSGRNWGVLAKRLSDERLVVVVDMRNHGNSFWSDSHTYCDMADDLAEVIAAHGGQMDVIGHSMGGKASMMLALRHPDMVRRLLVADIAPVTYGHSQLKYIEAMRQVDLNSIKRRADAHDQLAKLGVEPELQSFFTQSLDVQEKRWRYNLDALADQMPEIMSFPETDAQWPGTALFLSGAASDYVRPEHRPAILARFPAARFARIPKAGHWLHADNPRAFEATARAFLNA